MIDDNKITTELKSFLRKQGLTIEEHFTGKLNKVDFLTKEPIPFKNLDQYLKTDFVDKRNLIKWLKLQPREAAQTYICSKLQKRIDEKQPQFLFSQVELRSLKEIPAINIILEYFETYREVYNGSGHNIKDRLFYDLELIEKDNIGAILIDTREQKPLKFLKSQFITQKLDFGDYTYDSENYNKIHFERKSIEDLWGTLGAGYDRFNAEVERAKAADCYLIVLIDYTYSKAQSYNFEKRFSALTADYIFHRIRELMQKFDNLQFVFTGSREKSASLIEYGLKIGEQIKKIDIQYYLDSNKIKI